MIAKENYNHSKKSFLQSQKLIILSLTKRCNLNCIYCRPDSKNWYDMLSKNSEIVDLDKNKWESLAEFCKNNNIAEILLTGGEPVEYPYFKDLCLFLNSKDIKFSIHTNGTSLKWDSIIDFFKNYHIKPDIYLSLELFEDHQKILRGTTIPDNFIKKIIDDGFWVELKITLNGLLLEKSELLLDKLEEWADKGISSIRFQPLVPVSKNIPSEVLLNDSFVPLMNLLQEYHKNKKMSKIFRNSSLSYIATIDYLQGNSINKKCADICCAKDKIIFITPDYKFLNCKSLWQKDESKSCLELFDLVCCGFLSN
ncbi:MAG: radical SAM protein [Ignavibacteriales bacterium]